MLSAHLRNIHSTEFSCHNKSLIAHLRHKKALYHISKGDCSVQAVSLRSAHQDKWRSVFIHNKVSVYISKDVWTGRIRYRIYHVRCNRPLFGGTGASQVDTTGIRTIRVVPCSDRALSRYVTCSLIDFFVSEM